MSRTQLEGDLSGDGGNEIVTVWLGRSGERGFFEVASAEGAWASPVYPIWSAHLADLEGDGRQLVVAGSWSLTPRPVEPAPRRALWVLAWEDGRLEALWRASALPRPLRDFRVGDVDGDGRDEIVALELSGPGCGLTVYRWHGFGVYALGHRPLDAAECADVSLEAGPPDVPGVFLHEGSCCDPAGRQRRIALREDGVILDAPTALEPEPPPPGE